MNWRRWKEFITKQATILIEAIGTRDGWTQGEIWRYKADINRFFMENSLNDKEGFKEYLAHLEDMIGVETGDLFLEVLEIFSETGNFPLSIEELRETIG